MKKFLLLVPALLFIGCSTINQTIYLQDAKISGPISSPPQPVLDGRNNDKFMVTPRISINPNSNMKGMSSHSKVGPNGVLSVDTINNGDGTFSLHEAANNTNTFTGQNVDWAFSDFNAGMDFYLPASKTVAFIGSFNISTAEQVTLYGGSLGLQLIGQGRSANFSIAFGIHLQDMYYNVNSVVITETSGSSVKQVSFFQDEGSDNSYNVFFTLAVSTFSENLPGFYCNASYFTQTILKFEPKNEDPRYILFNNVNENDTRKTSTLHFVNINPGFYMNFYDNFRLNFGTRLLYSFDGLGNSNNPFIIQPELRLGFMF